MIASRGEPSSPHPPSSQSAYKSKQIMPDAIDNHMLETMPTSEEDLEIIFSKL